MISCRLHQSVLEVHPASIARCDRRTDHNTANWRKAVQSSDLVLRRLCEDDVCRLRYVVRGVMLRAGPKTKIRHLNVLI